MMKRSGITASIKRLLSAENERINIAVTNQTIKENLLRLLVEYDKSGVTEKSRDLAATTVALAIKAIDAYELFEGELDKCAE